MITDTQIQQHVIKALKQIPILHGSDIDVTVKNGIVTLSGYINSFTKMNAAEHTTKQIKEVKAVTIDLEVRLSVHEKRTDAAIAADAMEALKWNSFVPEDCMKIQVEDGWISLEGEVQWPFQRESVYDALKNVMGLHGIRNYMKVCPKALPLIVK